MSTKLFGASFPDWFGSIPKSAYSLFQIMTLESWSMGIVRPVMEKYVYAWLFFVPFILITTFTTLNLLIAVLVNSMQAESEAHAEQRAIESHDERLKIMADLQEIKKQISRLSKD
jgi:voltage-gated sodium channel